MSRNPKFWFFETHSLTQMNGFSGSTLSMQNAKLRCWLQTTDREGLTFSDFFDQCSLKVVTAKFDMPDLVRSILKAKLYKFIS